MIDPSHHRRPDPSVGVLPAVAVSIGLIVAVPVALWALANPAHALAAAVLLGAGVAIYGLLRRFVTDRAESRSQSPSSASGRAVRTDGGGEADA